MSLLDTYALSVIDPNVLLNINGLTGGALVVVNEEGIDPDPEDPVSVDYIVKIPAELTEENFATSDARLVDPTLSAAQAEGLFRNIPSLSASAGTYTGVINTTLWIKFKTDAAPEAEGGLSVFGTQVIACYAYTSPDDHYVRSAPPLPAGSNTLIFLYKYDPSNFQSSQILTFEEDEITTTIGVSEPGLTTWNRTYQQYADHASFAHGDWVKIADGSSIEEAEEDEEGAFQLVMRYAPPASSYSSAAPALTQDPFAENEDEDEQESGSDSGTTTKPTSPPTSPVPPVSSKRITPAVLAVSILGGLLLLVFLVLLSMILSNSSGLIENRFRITSVPRPRFN
jgi:hypothetical protein